MHERCGRSMHKSRYPLSRHQALLGRVTISVQIHVPQFGRATMEDGASMVSTPTMKENDPQSAVAIDPEIVLAARSDRVAATASGADAPGRPHERSAPVVAPQGPNPMAAPTPTIDRVFRPADADIPDLAGRRSSIATWAVRTGLAVLFAVFSAVAAAAWQTYGDQAQEAVGRWMPRISIASSSNTKDTSAASATTAETQMASNDAGTAASARSDAATSTMATAASSPDSAQLLQSMAHDLAAMGQQVADLKASIAQLKAGQDQMVQQMAARAPERAAEAKPFDPRAIEQTLRPRPAPRPPVTAPAAAAAAPVHRPRPVYQTAQPIAAPAPMALPSAPPPQTVGDPGVENVVRPPMPVR